MNDLEITICPECYRYVCKETRNTITNLNNENIYYCDGCHPKIQRILKNIATDDDYIFNKPVSVRISKEFRNKMKNMIRACLKQYSEILKEELKHLNEMDLIDKIIYESKSGTGLNAKYIYKYYKKLESTKGMDTDDISKILGIVKYFEEYYDK